MVVEVFVEAFELGFQHAKPIFDSVSHNEGLMPQRIHAYTLGQGY